MSTPTSEGTPVRTPWRDSCRRTSASSPSGRPPAACRRARSPTRGSRASSGGGPGCLKISHVPLLVRLGRRPLDVVPPAALDALEGSPVDEWLEALEGDAEVGGGLLAGHVLAPVNGAPGRTDNKYTKTSPPRLQFTQ